MRMLNHREVIEECGEYVLCKGFYGSVLVTDKDGEIVGSTAKTVRQAKIFINKLNKTAS